MSPSVEWDNNDLYLMDRTEIKPMRRLAQGPELNV